jgi:hypothetical protein
VLVALLLHSSLHLFRRNFLLERRNGPHVPERVGDAPLTAINKTINKPAGPREQHPTANPVTAVQKYQNQRGPGTPEGPSPESFGTEGLPGVHPDYANGYQVVSLLHPSGEIHHVAIPNGTSVNDVLAANPHYGQ